MKEISNLAWRIIAAMPIEVLDEDKNELWENETWELNNDRDSGDYAGSKVIGSGNIITAMNLIHLKLVAEKEDTEEIKEVFEEVLAELEYNNLIRKKPEKLRKTFKVVTDE